MTSNNPMPPGAAGIEDPILVIPVIRIDPATRETVLST